MALRIDSRALLGVAPHADLRGMAGLRFALESVGHGKALAPHADLRDVALRTLLSRALTLWDNGRAAQRAFAGRPASMDGFGRVVRSIWRGV